MVMTLQDFNETDEAKKDATWAGNVVTHLRQYMEPLALEHEYWAGMDILLGNHSMEEVKRLFKDPTASGASFIPIAVMEKIRNVIVSENENAGININLKAVDPTAVNKSQHDRELLANRKVIEVMISAFQESIGGPPFSLKNEKDSDGKKLFGGNVDMFDKMGLDDSSMEDLDYFFATYYRLRHEIKAEEPVNFFVKYNELSESVALYVNDILASKRISIKVFVNEITGAIDYKYLCPASVRFLGGNRRDLNDASAKSYEENVSVAAFIKAVGDEFDMSSSWDKLLASASIAGGKTYSGIRRDENTRTYALGTCDPNGDQGNGMHYGTMDGETVSYSEFLELSVGMGYIEWKSINGSTQKETQKNSIGNPSIFPARIDRTMTSSSMYKVVTRYTECTYKAYYLVLGPYIQKLYRFGKLSYQMIEGAEDEYSSFSIITYREKGKPAVKVAEPFIKMIQKAWSKFEHLVAAAKPPGRAYNYDSLVKIALSMYPEQGLSNSVETVLKTFYDSANELYLVPTTEDGRPIGGGNQSSYELPNGLSKSVLDFKAIVDYAFGMINDQLGISSLRDGGQSDPRDGFKLSMQALQYSHNATQYVRGMLMNMFNNIGKRTLSYTQDIIRFRSKNSVPYKFLLTALGDETMQDMDLLEDVPLHRYGIFVEALNTRYEREEVKNLTLQALQNKEISYEQVLLINDISSPKRASMILAYEKKRQERITAKKQQQADQQQMAIQQQNSAAQAQIQKDKIAGEIQIENIKGGYMVQVAQIQAGSKISQQTLKNDAKPGEIDSRKNASIEESQAKANMAAQAPLVH